jgi:hypothetical protein
MSDALFGAVKRLEFVAGRDAKFSDVIDYVELAAPSVDV